MNYQISGFPVQFPYSAYGVQLGFMNKVLQALGAQENALLEAPTGSGKTLSLLCSALAWQRKLKTDGCHTSCRPDKAMNSPGMHQGELHYCSARQLSHLK